MTTDMYPTLICTNENEKLQKCKMFSHSCIHLESVLLAVWSMLNSRSLFIKFLFISKYEICRFMAYYCVPGAAAASRIYVDAITKLARQAQQATWSGCTDIGESFDNFFFTLII